MLSFIFIVTLILSIYSYFLYPIILAILIRIKEKRAARYSGKPDLALTLIITAYNESSRIRYKIENALNLQFDKSRLEIIVASDCSDDGTDDIVREYADKGISLVRAEQRLGKENAQLVAIKQAGGDIIVFSDVATQMPADSLQRLVNYFSDPEVGAVSSEDRFISQDGSVAGEGAYVRYEMWLRKLESDLAGLVGLSGSFFAARKDVCQAWDIHSPSDFNTALNSAKLGYRSVSARDVLGYYPDLKDASKEYQRKIRTVIRGMTSLARHPEVLNPFRFGWFSFQVVSHKLMRWLVPWFLLAFFVTNLLIVSQSVLYLMTLAGQTTFYLIAVTAHFHKKFREIPIIKIVYFFVHVNAAIFDASCRFIAGRRMTMWKPSAR